MGEKTMDKKTDDNAGKCPVNHGKRGHGNRDWWPEALDIDLSQTLFVDSSGLGALFSLYKTTGNGSGIKLRLLNPAPPIQQLLELTQMHQFFEISND